MKSRGDIADKKMRIPILLPTGRDAALVGGILEQKMIDFVICSSFNDLLEQIVDGCGPFILGDEAISEAELGRLLQALDQQPEWSDLPGLIFMGRYPRWKALTLIAARRSLNLIQRPVKKSMLIIMVRTALEVRWRQYQIRDLLQDLRLTNEKLGQRTHLLQQLALDLSNSEEKERRRIARILHDDLQQILVAAKIQAGMLMDSLSGEVAGSVHTLYDTISSAIDTSRSLSHELNPSFLYGNDLAGISKKMVDKMAANYGLNIKTNIKVKNGNVDENLKNFICRTIQELLLNCAKYSKSDHVFLEIIDRDNFLTIIMADNGVGFDPKKLKIRGGNDGGFGLFSIQERIEALGGSFEVESSPNKGSRFVLNFPVTPKDSDKETRVNFSDMLDIAFLNDESEEEIEKNTAIRVIIADDHAVMRQGLASLLQNQPDILVAGEASNGEQAVELALKLRPDVILMDVSMPVLSGMEATRRINLKAPEIVVIGLSMHASEEVRKSMIDAGARGYLLKDRPASELLSAIKKFAHST
jgi:signal transduction histidine kinase/ActR/RegA family two-component response regulator